MSRPPLPPRPSKPRPAEPGIKARARKVGYAPLPPAPNRPRPHSDPRTPEPQRLYGVAAALAVLARRPDAILAVDHTPDVRAAITPLLTHAAKHNLPVREQGNDALARTAGALHHEGVCLTVRPRPLTSIRSLMELLHAAPGRPAGAALALDRVGNPHNLGAILRSAAYFGVRALIISEDPGQAQLSPAAIRVAEGGAEHVALTRVTVLAPALTALKNSGITIIGADARATEAAGASRWPRPCVVVLGNERTGMAEGVRAACDRLVSIPGSGAIDSLNVSVAAGVLLAALARA